MKALIEIATRRTERVFLVGAELKNRTSWEVQDSMSELSELAISAGGEVVGQGTQKLERPIAAAMTKMSLFIRVEPPHVRWCWTRAPMRDPP